jgi:hypothetical protein
MTNPFQTSELLKSISNYPVSKGGDVEGHEFHGNQHTGGIGGGGSETPARQSDPGRYQAGSGRYQASTESNGLGSKIRAKLSQINHFGDTKEEWEKKQRENAARRAAEPPTKHYTEMGKPGETLNWRGKWVPINPNSALDRALAMPLRTDRTGRPLDNGLPTL